MNLVSVSVRNVGRNKFRTFLTIAGVAVIVLFFVLLRTIIWSWTASGEESAADRIGVRHKVTFTMTLPKRYADEVREVPGITDAVHMTWFGAKDPKNESDFFATFAVDPTDLLKVYDEIKVPAAQAEAWKQNRRGALVGDVLASKRGWKIGDRITLQGTLYPGDWEFEISGIYTSTRATVDRSSLWFHWSYLNEAVDPLSRDQIGWILARIADPSRSAELCRLVDLKFGERDIQTLSMSESALQSSFLGMFSAVLSAIDVASLVILVIMLLILGNTIAMGVRERTGEYGVLRAIGFVPRHVVLFVVGEAITLGVIGGAVGVLLSFPLVERGFGRFLEENVGSFFPYFRVQTPIVLLVFGLTVALSALAAALPALRVSKLKVVDSLRRVA